MTGDAVAPAPTRCRCGHIRLEHLTTDTRPACARRGLRLPDLPPRPPGARPVTDNTSPVATLAARLPKGNGLSRAAEKLHGQNGALVYGVVAIRVLESAEDLNEVLKIKGGLERLELALGPLERDAQDLLTRCSEAATSRGGQATLFTVHDDDVEERRADMLRCLSEWQLEQEPVVSDEQLEERWRSFHGGNYDDRLTHGSPLHLREFAMSIGALADSDATAEVVADDQAEPDVAEPSLEEQADALLEAHEGYEGKDEERDDDGDPDAQPASLASPFLAPEDGDQ